MIANPGKIPMAGALRKERWPLAIMAPQDGSGGWTPSPRKLSPASERMARASWAVE